MPVSIPSLQYYRGKLVCMSMILIPIVYINFFGPAFV